MRIKWYISEKCLFLRNEVFLAKNKKILNIGKIRKYDEERRFFEEKTFSSLKIAALPNLEGAKYAGGSRPSCSSKHLKHTYILYTSMEC